MIEKNQIKLGNNLTPIGIAFYVAPYINAITRVGQEEEKRTLFEAMLEWKAYESIPSTKRGCKGQFETIVDQAVRNCTNVKNRQTRTRDQNLEIIEKLINNHQTISTMESCTGGSLANSITNIEGSSEVFNFSAITYSNDFKVKMGVSKDIIDAYSVYSFEVANEMSKNISKFTNSDYGVGITGKLNRIDINNPYGQDDLVYVSIYDKSKDITYNDNVKCTKDNRMANKELVINKVVEMLKEII